MARRKRASMREGPLADLFRSTEEPEDPPEAPAFPARRDERDDDTRMIPAVPEPEAQKRETPQQGSGPSTETAPAHQSGGEGSGPSRSEPPPAPSRAPIFDIEDDDPVESTAPGAKERLSRIFAEDAEPSSAMYGRDEPDYSRRSETIGPHAPVIRVVGVGGAGVNAVNRMVEAGIPGVEFMAINTDLQSLQQSLADVTVHLGTGASRGLGAGSNPELGYRSAFEEQDKIKRLLIGRRHRHRRGARRSPPRPGRRCIDRGHRHQAIPLRGNSPGHTG
jgi:cell division protein FtsZ